MKKKQIFLKMPIWTDNLIHYRLTSDHSWANPIQLKISTREISKNKSLIVESVQNVNPPDIMGHQIKAYSLKLAFSKEYAKKIEELYPELDIGKILLLIYLLILPKVGDCFKWLQICFLLVKLNLCE